jgi:hypothetical protein
MAPEPPRNVRAVLPDRTVPLELVYRGRDPEGIHCWVATMPLHLSRRGGLRIECDSLPGYTSIEIELVETTPRP